MVEDEFRAVAGIFTAHLHAAEYHRLKALAKTQNAETINSISRPVTGAMTDAVARRRGGIATAKRQSHGLRSAIAPSNGAQSPGTDGSEDDGEELWKGTSLQGLMKSPCRKAIPLSRVITTIPAGTRAAAGYHEGSPSKTQKWQANFSSHTRRSKESGPTNRVHGGVTSKAASGLHDSDDEDDDDLDAAPRRPQAADQLRNPVASGSAARERPWPLSGHDGVEEKSGPFDTGRVKDASGDDGLGESNFARKIRERRSQQSLRSRRSNNTDTNEVKSEIPDNKPLDSIPSFL